MQKQWISRMIELCGRIVKVNVKKKKVTDLSFKIQGQGFGGVEHTKGVQIRKFSCRTLAR